MAAQSGRTLTIRVSDGAGGWEALACSREDSLNSEVGEINVTDKCSSNFRELIEGGIKSMSLSTSGVVKDHSLFQKHLSGVIDTYQVQWEDTGDTLEGDFQIGTYSETGNYENNAIEYTGEFRSSGEFTFTEGV